MEEKGRVPNLCDHTEERRTTMKKVMVALGVAMLSVMSLSSVAWGKDKDTNGSIVRQMSPPD